jgi:hypothetical protein
MDRQGVAWCGGVRLGMVWWGRAWQGRVRHGPGKIGYALDKIH